ncbi:MAG: hypothetical protein ACPGWR_24070, partial [Ardenticatenaceae bacterium]
CSTKAEQAGMRVLPKPNKQGCVFYQSRTSRDACSTKAEQAGEAKVVPSPRRVFDMASFAC